MSLNVGTKKAATALTFRWFARWSSKALGRTNHQGIKRRSPWLVIIALMLQLILLSSNVGAQQSQHSEQVKALIAKLPDASLREAPKILEQLADVADDSLLPMFQYMLEGELYYILANNKVIMLTKDIEGGDAFEAREVLTGAEIERISDGEIKKIRVNNRLRIQLREIISKITLFGSDPKVRIRAVETLLDDLNDENVALLQEALATEKKKAVINQIKLALNVAKLDSDDGAEKKAAISGLAGELNPAVRNKLRLFLQQDGDGEYLEQDAGLVVAAQDALESIEAKLEFYRFIERLFFGLSLGSVLLLAAIGLSITFGVMGVINMAHGELLMLGAYTTYVIQLLMPDHITLSIFVAIPAAFIVCAIVGIGIERGVIQFLKGRPLETLLATFGLSLILQQTVRTIFSPLNRQVSTPEFMSGIWQINPGFSITYNRLYILIFSLIVFFILLTVMKRTSLGLYVRAVSQNRDMARSVGIRSEWVDAMTFGLGSGIAGVAGVALSQLTNVGPNLGQSYIIDSFMVVVFGGVGNLWGTLVGAFSLGIFGKFLEPHTGTVLAQILVLVFIVLFIQKRPRGLFPQKGRAAE